MNGLVLTNADWERLARAAHFQPSIMAALYPMSLRHLERVFARTFGQTPTQWARELRCRLALTLVLQGWSNKAIAWELNYTDQSQLCHQFKRVYGASPQSFAPHFAG